ncbi:hypothetical protein HPB47_012138 [Ixodes persulcatus]|uniref:Uncharacterized protein n=1 Tax=Ixodes persulcatus TaxID=34615 RepID=A0AC60NUD1_IXOPE|nr:hypothetical protein HPB47_012138 [Ixodes persulcatus]
MPTEWKEAQFSVPYGHLAAKLWGDQSLARTNVLALHGWRNNAGTFDTLVPLLSSDGTCIECMLALLHTPALFWEGLLVQIVEAGRASRKDMHFGDGIRQTAVVADKMGNAGRATRMLGVQHALTAFRHALAACAR